MVQYIKGKNSKTNVNHLKDGQDTLTPEQDISNKFSWKVHDDLCGSDHFPIILESLKSTVGDKPTRYKFNKADWTLYEQMCREKRQTEKYEMPPI